MHNAKNHDINTQIIHNDKGMLADGAYGHFRKQLNQNVLD